MLTKPMTPSKNRNEMKRAGDEAAVAPLASPAALASADSIGVFAEAASTRGSVSLLLSAIDSPCGGLEG